ncbi:MAG: DegT/DnrJ/EryC1/StrS family aminotransferase [Proteobacteria bacterium]|nr:DegT/DnrJ/EryC1/StrS family aminotransferase [Pseudomonadota bacterium]
MNVKLLDLDRQYRKIKNEVMREVKAVCDSQHYVLGPNVKALEEEIAAYSGAKYAVGVASGTDAILLALMAAGVGPGDKVVTTPYTFFSTAGSIALLGAVPVFVDIEPDTFNIDPNALERLLKKSAKNVKAVMPVHLYGQCAEMDTIRRLAHRHNLMVIEDAAQSIGARYKGRAAGALGDFGCFSFYPTKNLGCFGDGGMVTTNSKQRAEKLRMLRGHGSRRRYYYDIVGTNSRLDEIQAAVLRVKLKYLDSWAEGRRKNADKYTGLFAKAGLGTALKVPEIRAENVSVYNQYIVLVKKRDALRKYLAAKGVGSEIYYPMSLHQQKCFKDLGYKKGDFPVSESVARQTLALPIYPELKPAELKYVVSTIVDFYSK